MLSIEARSQVDNIEWAPIGATWLYTTFCQSCKVDARLVYINDSIVNGQEVKKMNLYQRNYICSPDPNGSGNLICSSFTESLIRSDFMFNRNDSVFWLQNSEFDLLYCFGANQGDAWKINQGYTLITPCDTLPLFDSALVNKKDTLLYSSMKYVACHTKSKNNNWAIGTVVKNIGSLRSPFPSPEYNNCIIDHTPYFLITEGLSCYYDSKRGYVNFSPSNTTQDCQSSITAVPQLILDNTFFEIYPNPANSILTVKILNSIDWSYQIYDLLGKKYSDNKFTNTNQIDVSGLKTGCYLLQLTDNNGNNQVSRFIKY